MTRGEERRAFELRQDGYTWEEIGEALHYNGQTVRDALLSIVSEPRSCRAIPYPKLREYINTECGGSIKLFAARCEVSRATAYRVLLRGEYASPRFIEKIYQVTGLNRKEAFER